MRENCYECWRPRSHCVCGTVPAVPNRTKIHIIQHPREKRHAIGTVRLLNDGLQNIAVHVAGPWDDGFADLKNQIPPDAGLLFPGPDAKVLAELSEGERPKDLVVLDGTWGHARTLFSESPWMADLQRFVIEPSEPSRYRIRKEPKVEFVSTLEAVVYALNALEPELENLNELVPAFDRMIDKAIASHKDAPRERKKSPTSSKPSVTFPAALLVPRKNLVLVHVDVVSKKADGLRREPLVWSALRLGTGEARRWHMSPQELDDEPYLHEVMGIEGDDIDARITQEEFQSQWLDWLEPDDAVAAWSPWHLSLFSQGERLVADVKGAYCNLVQRKASHLQRIPDEAGLKVAPAVLPGRAGERLAQLEAVVDLIRRKSPVPPSSDGGRAS